MAKTKLAFIADLHYYSPRLGTTGRAYDLRQGSDQKCLAESGAIIDAAFERLLSEPDVDALVISGDVTNDGEKCSHDEVRAKFLSFAEKKPLYLITSTHDWCTDHNPRRFEGNEVFHDVETLDAETLDAYYRDFGRENLVDEYETGRGFHSRCFQVGPTLRLLAVNDDMDGEGGKSGYSEAHLQWMEKQLADAKAAGCDVIATEHHLLLWGISGLINKGQSIGDNFAVASRLADAGLRLMFVGHSHMQRTTEFTSENGNKITQVNVGSLCGHPAPINYVTVEDGKAHIEVKCLERFTYEGEEKDASFIRDHSTAVLTNLLHAAAEDKQDFRERLESQGIHIKPLDKIYPIIRHYAKLALGVSVGKAAKKVNRLTFGRGVDKKAAKAIKNEPLLPHILDIFCCVFDGSMHAKDMSEETRRVATDVSTLPRRVISKAPIKKAKKEKIFRTTDEIEKILQELINPSLPDNTDCVVDLR